MLAGYKLINTETGEVVMQWGGEYGKLPALPNPIPLPSGDMVCGAKVGDTLAGYRLDAWEMEAPDPTADDVNRERDRRITSNFLFDGAMFQSRQEDRENINGAGTLAALAIMAGAQPGDLRWHGGEADFVWIAADNTLVPMDAYKVVEFGRAAATWKSQHIFAARTLKDMDPIPADYTDDVHWPQL